MTYLRHHRVWDRVRASVSVCVSDRVSARVWERVSRRIWDAVGDRVGELWYRIDERITQETTP